MKTPNVRKANFNDIQNTDVLTESSTPSQNNKENNQNPLNKATDITSTANKNEPKILPSKKPTPPPRRIINIS